MLVVPEEVAAHSGQLDALDSRRARLEVPVLPVALVEVAAHSGRLVAHDSRWARPEVPGLPFVLEEWRPIVASLLRMILGGLDLRCRDCRLRLRRWRPALAGLILSRSL